MLQMRKCKKGTEAIRVDLSLQLWQRMNRDKNVAINIREEARRMLSA